MLTPSASAQAHCYGTRTLVLGGVALVCAMGTLVLLLTAALMHDAALHNEVLLVTDEVDADGHHRLRPLTIDAHGGAVPAAHLRAHQDHQELRDALLGDGLPEYLAH